jgi:small subunit ribosomal protein S16
MVRLRLRRVGSKGQPSYRVVAADSETPRDGRFLEVVGHYNPRTEPSTIKLDEARIYDWLGRGALPTESVGQIFRSAGLMERYARYKAGEALETLVAEAATAEAGRAASPKTKP